MRWSKSFIPTLRDVPADATITSHVLMLRAGYIRQLASGVYSFLPLGWKSMLKTVQIIREELNAIGAQELLLPLIHPISIWQETGRDKDMGEIMFHFKDRKNQDFCLAPTHEEIITDLARGELRSYKELPQIWYHFQTKFRDEPRPRSGLLRVREFIMKDSYTLAGNEKELDESYKQHRKAYRRIFERCGLKYHIVGASSGLMGGTGSEEFMVPSESGEDIIVTCECGFSQNLEIAKSIPQKVAWKELERNKVHTPEQKTIEEVSKFLDLPEGQMLKSLLYITQTGDPVLACLRGDHDLSEDKLGAKIGEAIRPAEPEEAIKLIGGPVGFIGPIGLKNKIKILVDKAVDSEMPFATGANEQDYHITGYKLEDIEKYETCDLRQAVDGDFCEKCGKPLSMIRTVEIGHIFKLGTKYSAAMGAEVLDENGKGDAIHMGSYGIGVGRILASAIELYADKDGICWPISISPYDVIITALNMGDDKIREVAEDIYNALNEEKIDVLFDDRDMRAGAKFKDADLLGIPIRITIGRGVSRGVVEVFRRDNKEKTEVPIETAVKEVMELRQELMDQLS